MSTNQKKLVTGIITVALIAMFVWAFASSNSDTQTQEESEEIQDNSHTSGNSGSNEEVESGTGDNNASVPEQEENEAEEELSEQEIEETQELAKDFIDAFVQIDNDNPGENIEKAKPFMSGEMYQKLIDNPERPLLTHHKSELIEMNITDASRPNHKVVWNVVTRQRVFDVEENETIEEHWYLVEIDKVDGAYKVVDIHADTPH